MALFVTDNCWLCAAGTSNSPGPGGVEIERVHYLLNAFSANMLESFPADIKFAEISLEEAKRLAARGFASAVGHADTAKVFSSVIGVPVPANRINVSLKEGHVALIGQYRGPRLPEGATELPEGATIQWLLMAVGPF
jgi:hypothetical protein